MNTDDIRNIIHGNLQDAMDLIGGHSVKVLKPLDEPQIIFYGAPGTGKSHTIDEQCPDDATIRTTFHPDTDYASFVGAYKPTMADVPINLIHGESVQFATGKNGHPGTEKKIVYKYVPQAFLKAYVAAWSDLDNPHYLVIEEINRGNCAQIFGDLFQLLDRNNTGSSAYAIHADEDIAQFLRDDDKGFGKLTEEQREAIREFVLVKDSGKREEIGKAILKGEKLLLPPNLYIWATMNTSDQSLFPIDTAFKRRWNWKYIPIDYTKKQWQLEVGSVRYMWADFLRKINPLIHTLTESADKQMGYFFAKADKKTSYEAKENDLISEDIFLNKVLFYLWTDVLKDFDAGQEPFIDSETHTTYNFGDFFDPEKGKAKLAEFVGKLGLEPANVIPTEKERAIKEEKSVDIIEDSVYERYSVGEKKCSRRACQGLIVSKAISKAIANGNQLTVEDLFNVAKQTFRTPNGKEMNKPFFLTEEDWTKYAQSSNDDRISEKFETATYTDTAGTKFYVYCNFGAADENNIYKFAQALGVDTTGLSH